MIKRLSLALAAGAALLGTASPALATTSADALTCGHHVVTTTDTRYFYYGNCADHAVEIHVMSFYMAPDGWVTTGDEGNRCVPAMTDYLLGDRPSDIAAGLVGTEVAIC